LKSIPIRSAGFIIAVLFVACLASCRQAEVTLTIGSGSGSPGSKDNMVEITIDNPVTRIKGVQADICDEGNYLHGAACEPVGSASEFTCSHNELSDGCFRIMLLSLSGDVIPEKAGHIINVSYNVSDNAPEGRCVALTTKEVRVADEDTNPLATVMRMGSFCF
jgi:hypothetical protein